MKNFVRVARPLKRALMAIAALLLLWIYLSPRVSPGLYESKLFHPEKERGKIADLRAFNAVPNHEVFFLANDGKRLHGWMFTNPGATKIFLLHPGNAGDIARRLDFIKMLLQSGVSVFAYEPRGFGMSAGKPSVSSICEDGLSAFDYLTVTLGYNPNRIILYGVSLGASVASYVSTHRWVRAIILQSGFSSLEQIAKEHVPLLRIYPSWLFPRPVLDNEGIMSMPHAPLLILHGGLDNIIPFAHSKAIYDRAASPKQFVPCPNSTHLAIDPQDRRLFVGALTQFVQGL